MRGVKDNCGISTQIELAKKILEVGYSSKMTLVSMKSYISQVIKQQRPISDHLYEKLELVFNENMCLGDYLSSEKNTEGIYLYGLVFDTKNPFSNLLNKYMSNILNKFDNETDSTKLKILGGLEKVLGDFEKL